MSNPKLWLNKSHLLHNLRSMKKKTSSDFICPMVKANAYGVGDTLVVSTLLEMGVKHFGVARVFEAEKLRRTFPNISFDILIFHPLEKERLSSYLFNELTAVVSSLHDIELLESLDEKERLRLKPLHLKIDLGMNRLGFKEDQVFEIKEKLSQLNLKVEGVCGHFPTAGDYGESSGRSEPSLKNLVELAKVFGVSEEHVHAPNSEALVKSDFNVGLRPGIALYGVTDHEDFKGALKLTAPVVSINTVLEGQKVSYGGLWEAKVDTKVGILPIGYADGLRRGLSDRIKFEFNGQFYDQVGAVCMDYCMVNFTADSDLLVGMEMTLFDEDLKDLYGWAKALNTLPYEILTGLGDRVERKVL